MAGLLARDSTSGRLPGPATSDIMPIVLAYSGGSAGESHPSSLSSPCGHLDPIFSFRAVLRICGVIGSGIMAICQEVIRHNRFALAALHQSSNYFPVTGYATGGAIVGRMMIRPYTFPSVPLQFPFPVSSQHKLTSFEVSPGSNTAELVTARNALPGKPLRKCHLSLFIQGWHGQC